MGFNENAAIAYGDTTIYLIFNRRNQLVSPDFNFPQESASFKFINLPWLYYADDWYLHRKDMYFRSSKSLNLTIPAMHITR